MGFLRNRFFFSSCQPLLCLMGFKLGWPKYTFIYFLFHLLVFSFQHGGPWGSFCQERLCCVLSGLRLDSRLEKKRVWQKKKTHMHTILRGSIRASFYWSYFHSIMQSKMRIHSRTLSLPFPPIGSVRWWSITATKALLVTDPFSRYDVDPELTYSVDQNPPLYINNLQSIGKIFWSPCTP